MQYIILKNKEIPIQIKSYSTSKSIKIYFRKGILCITKPKRISNKKIEKLIKENSEKIYKQYLEEETLAKERTKKWEEGEEVAYKGENYIIQREYWDKLQIEIQIKNENKIIQIKLPKEMTENQIIEQVKKVIKRILKKNTEIMLEEKLPYWSQITKIEYNSYKVRDAATKYGSCLPTKKALHFTSRLIMLPEEIIDSIIVHELCHIRYPNHSKTFYQEIEKYIPNYTQIRKWLKQNNKMTEL